MPSFGGNLVHVTKSKQPASASPKQPFRSSVASIAVTSDPARSNASFSSFSRSSPEPDEIDSDPDDSSLPTLLLPTCTSTSPTPLAESESNSAFSTSDSAFVPTLLLLLLDASPSWNYCTVDSTSARTEQHHTIPSCPKPFSPLRAGKEGCLSRPGPRGRALVATVRCNNGPRCWRHQLHLSKSLPIARSSERHTLQADPPPLCSP